MVIKERNIGELYFDGKKIADNCEVTSETVDLTEDFKNRGIDFPKGLTVTLSNFRLKRNDMLSLIYGMKITNNYLKLHGGIMMRQVAGRKGVRKLK